MRNEITSYRDASQESSHRLRRVVPCLGTHRPMPWDTSSHALGRIVPMLLLLFMLVSGSTKVWGQTDYSGIYYIGSGGNAASVSNKSTAEAYSYNVGSPNTNYYLVPTNESEPATLANKSDVYHDETGAQEPFLTTYKIGHDNEAVWVLKQVTDDDGTFYYVIHAKTNKYVVYDPYFSGNNYRRKCMHLQAMVSPTENAKFVVSERDGAYCFIPKEFKDITPNNSNTYIFWNIADKNRNSRKGLDASNYWGGLVGLYCLASNSTVLDANSKWKFESGLLDAPTISDVDPATNKVTVTGPDWLPTGYKIRYTISTDGNAPADPDASSIILENPSSDGFEVSETCIIKAVVERYGVVLSEVATSGTLVPSRCATPAFTYSTETGKVTITSGTDGASIYYTLDETTPTSGNTLYEGPFEIANLTTVKAIAVKTGILDSEVASVKLVLNPIVTLAENECTYDGSAKEPTVSSVKDGETIISPDEYNVSYGNNFNVGDAAIVTIRDKAGGDYIVYGSTTFTINPKAVTITANDASKMYDGTALTDGGFTTTALETGDTHTFIVVMTAESTITNVGTQPNVIASVDGIAVTTGTETAVGNYLVTTANGTLKVTPKSIGDGNRPADDITIELAADGTLSAVKQGDRTLVEDTDYTYTTEDFGEDKVFIITGMGNYTGSAKGIYACPKFTDPDGTTGLSKAAAVYMALRDYAKPAGITPYIVRKVNPSIGTMVISEIAYIPEGVPVLLLSDTEVSGFTVSPKDEAVPEISAGTKNSNQLKVAPEEGVAVEAAQVYMFYKGEFVLTKKGTLTEGKFYLYNPNYAAVPDGQGSANGSRGSLQIVIEDWDDSEEPTGMISTTPDPSFQQEGSWYTLDGRCLSGEPTKSGIYIRKGQKVYIKKK